MILKSNQLFLGAMHACMCMSIFVEIWALKYLADRPNKEKQLEA